jgi:YVTN family beta-propeller protein
MSGVRRLGIAGLVARAHHLWKPGPPWLVSALLAVGVAPPAGANNIVGAWSPVTDWPLIAIHAVLTPDSRVLTYGTDGNGRQTAYFIYDVWDTRAGLAGGHVTLPNVTGTDIFCSAQLVLPQDGSVFVSGGDNFEDGSTTNTGNNNTNLFDYRNDSLTRGNNLNRARWYGTATTLPNGEVYIQGGDGGEDHPEIRGLDGSFRLLEGADTSDLSSEFPRNFIAPNGRIFGFDTSGRMYYVDPAGEGSFTRVGNLGYLGGTSSAAMFRRGRILQMGGGSTRALVVDVNGASPAVTATQSNSSMRHRVNATVLADGRVVATGGSGVNNELEDVNNRAEIWSPASGQWLQGAEGSLARLYHSTALLLPDASVLVAGGGAPGPLTNLNAEVYYPPYLFDASGAFAPRPRIASAPATLKIGGRFPVTFADASAIKRVTLVKTGSVTHGFNMDQRFLELFYSASGDQLDVMAPARASDAPPGYYLLFLFDDRGVPSVGKILRVDVAADLNPPADHTPTIGGLAGGRFQLACNADEVLVGAYGRAGTVIQQVGAQCIRADRNGRWIGDPVNRTAAGGSAGSAFSKACPRDFAVTGFRGRGGRDLDQLDLECKALDATGTVSGPGQWLGAVGGSGGTAQGPYGCATSNPAYALHGTAGSSVDGLGIECRRAPVGGPPTIDNPGDQSGSVGAAVDLPISASDPNGDVLSYAASGLPPGLAIDGASGRITGTPTTLGEYSVIVDVSDGSESASAAFTWTVANPNAAPRLVNPGDQEGTEGTAVDLEVEASDPDGDVLGFGASGLPPGLGIDAGSGRITGTPTTEGSYDTVLTVSDGRATDSAAFRWTVFSNEPFVLHPLPPSPPQPVHEPVTFTASSSHGVNVRYKWRFDDGTPETAYSSSPSVAHAFANPGVYHVSVTAVDDRSPEQSQSVAQAVHPLATPLPPKASTNIVYEPRADGEDRVWVVNQDNDSVSVFDARARARLKEITVGTAPRALALAPSGDVWVTNKRSATLSIIDPDELSVRRTVNLPFASQPFGIGFSPTGDHAYVVLAARGELLKLDAASGALIARLDVGPHPRHLAISHDGRTVLVPRFVTPPQPGEDTGTVLSELDGMPYGGEVVVIDTASMSARRTVVLQHSDEPDFEDQGSGVPNYLGAPAISPDGGAAWVPSKQDNVMRGVLRSGRDLNFQNTVRAISSRVDLATESEDYPSRVDHDDAGVASAASFDRYGIYLFVALETSREVAVVDAYGRFESFRFDVGRAPQGLAVSDDGLTLYVNNFMDRTVGVYDLSALLGAGEPKVTRLATLPAIASESLSAAVLTGKQLFYDARDPRLARDRYLSCAACHNDGGQDGRVWDLTGFGEGLRNTISLAGRAAGQGPLHWSANFDEVQDFEGQIRTLAGGSGLMSDAAFHAGTRAEPLGDPKAGLSADLDALAAYVASLDTFASSPYRSPEGTLTSDALSGKAIFRNVDCSQCHGGTAFTDSGAATLHDVGTIQPASGTRLSGPLTGIDTATLRDVWETAPYLHDGSAATLSDAVRAHDGVSLSDSDLALLVSYLRQIGSQETEAPLPGPGSGAQPVTWTSLVNVTVTGGTLKKTSGWESTPDAGAISAESIPSGEGYLELTASETNTQRLIGLSHGNTDTGWVDIDFAVVFWPSGVADVRENGLYRYAETPYSPGDVFRIAVKSGIVKFYKNGTLFFTSARAPTYPLLVDTAFFTLGGTLRSVVLSAGQ